MESRVSFSPVRTNEPASVYRTSNQTYGGRAPTVHEMPVSGERGAAHAGGG